MTEVSSIALWQQAQKILREQNPDIPKGRLPKRGSELYDRLNALHKELVAKARNVEYVPPKPTYVKKEESTAIPSTALDEIAEVLARHRKPPPVAVPPPTPLEPQKVKRGRPKKVQSVEPEPVI